MAESLTDWEKSQIIVIDKLIRKCQLRSLAFEREHFLLYHRHDPEFEMSDERVSERLRYFATDLYSVLDYLCYLCYCHYKNNGEFDHSEEARNVKFPYKELKKSDFDAMNDSCRKDTTKFLWFHFNTIFNYTFRLPNEIDKETQKRYEDFKEIIEECQVVTKVDGQGQKVPQDQEQRHEAKSFSTLHYLRNITVHRNLINSRMPTVWLYVNLQDGTREFSAEEKMERTNDSDKWRIEEFPKGCCITLPSVCLDRPEDGREALLIILDRLLHFVINTRNKLLRMVSDHIPIYNRDTACGFSGTDDADYVFINPIWEEKSVTKYSWREFERICGINKDNSCLWAV